MICPECNVGNCWCWFNHINEAGWLCGSCGKFKPGEPPGFCPQLDRWFIREKVASLLLSLHHDDFIWVSNSDHGEDLAGVVAQQCEAAGLFDQYSICRFIFEAMSDHGAYWKNIADGVLSGNDPRERCACGKLATRFCGDGRFCNSCTDSLTPF